MNKSKFLTTFVLLIICVVATVRPIPIVTAAPIHVEKMATLSSAAAVGLPGVRFVHSATNSNTAFNWTTLDHPLLNSNPNAIFLVTQNWNPGGVGSTYNNNEIGVYYVSGQWHVFNQNTGNPMPVGADFNIFIPDAGSHVFTHTAITGNIFGNYTVINHPLLNNNPNALIMVTQNWNPGGVGGIYNNHPIGVFYATSSGRWCISNYDGAAMPTNAGFNIVVANPASTAFVHQATASNISLHTTTVDHPLLNGNPNAIVLVTQNYNPGGVGGTYNSHPIGVYYSSGKWRIFNQDAVNMPTNASFNVLVPDTRTDVFVQKRAASDVSYATMIDHPLLNNNPNAIFLVTPNWNPGNGSGIYNNHAIHVWYNAIAGKWLIRNQNSASMSVGAGFNVLIPPPGANVFVHKATASNITSNFTDLDHPLLNGNPNAIFLVTQNYNPGGSVSGTFNNHPIGVFYAGGVWSIFNQDIVGMPVGASFNVMVLNDLTGLPGNKAAFVHTAVSGDNIVDNWTAWNHPLSNDMPPALVFATHNYNPSGAGGVYNNHNIGVWYTGDEESIQNRWALFNQDNLAMPNNASFNVLIIVRQLYLPLVVK